MDMDEHMRTTLRLQHQSLRLFAAKAAQPHARLLLIMVAVVGLHQGLHAPFWFVIAALAGAYFDWMFTAFAMPLASKVAGWLGILCAIAAIATLAWGW